MKALIQRVKSAHVEVGDKNVGSIDQGLVALVAIEPDDDYPMIERMAHKLTHYRLFSDELGKMNLNVQQIDGAILMVSQFTLAANTDKGLRPSFSSACPPEKAKTLFDELVTQVSQICSVQTGQFGADMQVHLINDGPVTFMLEL